MAKYSLYSGMVYGTVWKFNLIFFHNNQSKNLIHIPFCLLRGLKQKKSKDMQIILAK
jgi:hypothetical protein